jgi:hypothetical protein
MSALLDMIRQRLAELEAARQPPPELLARYKRLDDSATADEIFRSFSMAELGKLFGTRHEDAIDLLEKDDAVRQFELASEQIGPGPPETAVMPALPEAPPPMPPERSRVATSLATSEPLSNLTRQEKRRARVHYGWNLSR